MIAVLAAG